MIDRISLCEDLSSDHDINQGAYEWVSDNSYEKTSPTFTQEGN